MNINLGDIAILLVLLAAAGYWWRAQGVREMALRAVRLHCQKLGLQLLDDNVALRAFWLKRDHRGSLCLWRAYQFDFTATGDERYQGRVVTLGHQVEAIHLPPHRYGPSEDKLH